MTFNEVAAYLQDLGLILFQPRADSTIKRRTRNAGFPGASLIMTLYLSTNFLTTADKIRSALNEIPGCSADMLFSLLRHVPSIDLKPVQEYP